MPAFAHPWFCLSADAGLVLASVAAGANVICGTVPPLGRMTVGRASSAGTGGVPCVSRKSSKKRR